MGRRNGNLVLVVQLGMTIDKVRTALPGWMSRTPGVAVREELPVRLADLVDGAALRSESQRCSNDLCGLTLATSVQACGIFDTGVMGWRATHLGEDEALQQAADLNVVYNQYGQREQVDRLEVKPPIEVESATWSAAGKLDFW